MRTYNYSKNYWDHILPDGSAFCHWGGRDISNKVLELLDLKINDKLCDLCCGEAGTLTLLDQYKIEIYGIDISESALKKADIRLKERLIRYHLVQTDVQNMPFPNDFFNKLFAQDPDVLLHPKKRAVIKEISRVSKPEAIFVLQTYCTTSRLTIQDKKETNKRLNNLGYPYTDVINKKSLLEMLESAGFEIQSTEDIHDIYSQDNHKMIKRLEKNWLKIIREHEKQGDNIKKLLYWERTLFQKRAWTGVIIKAKKKKSQNL